MRPLRFARAIFAVSFFVWGAPLLLAVIGAGIPQLFGISLIGMVVMILAAFACVVLQIVSRRT
ncbi:MAG TPA: hypothetical protein VGE65_08225 [Sphingobium sp.]